MENQPLPLQAISSHSTENADDYDSPWKEAVERYFAEFMAFYFSAAHAQIDWRLMNADCGLRIAEC